MMRNGCWWNYTRMSLRSVSLIGIVDRVLVSLFQRWVRYWSIDRRYHSHPHQQRLRKRHCCLGQGVGWYLTLWHPNCRREELDYAQIRDRMVMGCWNQICRLFWRIASTGARHKWSCLWCSCVLIGHLLKMWQEYSFLKTCCNSHKHEFLLL